MCGITGYICHKSMTSDEKQKIIWGMTDSLSHRGPDFKDTWVSADKNIALGHSRLSILDLSNNGNQPMFSDKKNFLLVFIIIFIIKTFLTIFIYRYISKI